MARRPHQAWALALVLLALAGSASCSRVWVYTLVNTDYGGSQLLPHFFNYYHSLGMTWRRFLVLLHHTPGKYSRKGLEDAMGICSGYAVECRVWEGQYSSEAHLEQQLGMLDDYVSDPTDWIMPVDVDEFVDFGGRFIKEGLIKFAEKFTPTPTFIRGRLIDRVAADGSLAPVAQPMGDSKAGVLPLFQQYPLTCAVARKLYKGWDTKIVAYRAHLRASRGNQHIIEADDAAAYFGPCSTASSSASAPPCARPRGFNLDADLFSLTPYHRFKESYRYKDSPHDKRPPGLGLWIALEAETVVDVHHFKWHAGLLNNMKDRMEWYRGDCELGVKEEPACTPRLAHWRDAALTHAALAGGQPIDTAAMGCARPAKDVQANTTYAGLAWEWMEDWLNVHEGSSGGNIPKQYRLGQFKQGAG